LHEEVIVADVVSRTPLPALIRKKDKKGRKKFK
jgi:hypothetical protein